MVNRKIKAGAELRFIPWISIRHLNMICKLFNMIITIELAVWVKKVDPKMKEIDVISKLALHQQINRSFNTDKTTTILGKAQDKDGTIPIIICFKTMADRNGLNLVENQEINPKRIMKIVLTPINH